MSYPIFYINPEFKPRFLGFFEASTAPNALNIARKQLRDAGHNYSATTCYIVPKEALDDYFSKERG